MKSHMKILILLACLSLICPAICVDIVISGGSVNMVSSPNGIVSGGDFMTTDVSTPTELGFTAGVRAHAELPEGADGFAYSHWTRSNNTSMSMTATNGNGYVLTVGYGGTVNADVAKTSLMGVAMSDAQISAHAHANADTNQIDGSANINASTSNTGFGQTRALAVGNARYDVRQTNDTGAPGKSVFGNVNGAIDLHSVNLDSGASLNSSGLSLDTPQGNVSGSAYIRSMSEANNLTSRSNATMSIENLGAMRLGKDGVSHIGGTVMGNATAGTSNGVTISNMNNSNGNNSNGNNSNGNMTGTGMGNESTLAMVKGALGGMANAYAPGDIALASSRLRSDATNTMGGGFNNMTNTTDGGSNNDTNTTMGRSFINATGTANTYVSVVRTNTSFPATSASAESMISNGSVNATSRNSTSTTTSGNGNGNGNGNETGNSNSSGAGPVSGGGSGSGNGTGLGDGSGSGGGVGLAANDNGNVTNSTSIPLTAESSATRIDMRSAISAKNAWAGNNYISSTLVGSYDAGSDSASAVEANITNTIVNNGPPMTGSVADFSIADENITGQHVRATYGASTNGTSNNNSNNNNGTLVASIDLARLSMLSFIDGNTSTPGGLAVLGPVSPPVFDNSTGAQNNVTGPTAMPGMGPDQNSNVITYNATARQTMNSSMGDGDFGIEASNASPLSF